MSLSVFRTKQVADALAPKDQRRSKKQGTAVPFDIRCGWADGKVLAESVPLPEKLLIYQRICVNAFEESVNRLVPGLLDPKYWTREEKKRCHFLSKVSCDSGCAAKVWMDQMFPPDHESMPKEPEIWGSQVTLGKDGQWSRQSNQGEKKEKEDGTRSGAIACAVNASAPPEAHWKLVMYDLSTDTSRRLLFRYVYSRLTPLVTDLLSSQLGGKTSDTEFLSTYLKLSQVYGRGRAEWFLHPPHSTTSNTSCRGRIFSSGLLSALHLVHAASFAFLYTCRLFPSALAQGLLAKESKAPLTWVTSRHASFIKPLVIPDDPLLQFGEGTSCFSNPLDSSFSRWNMGLVEEDMVQTWSTKLSLESMGRFSEANVKNDISMLGMPRDENVETKNPFYCFLDFIFFRKWASIAPVYTQDGVQPAKMFATRKAQARGMAHFQFLLLSHVLHVYFLASLTSPTGLIYQAFMEEVVEKEELNKEDHAANEDIVLDFLQRNLVKHTDLVVEEILRSIYCRIAQRQRVAFTPELQEAVEQLCHRLATNFFREALRPSMPFPTFLRGLVSYPTLYPHTFLPELVLSPFIASTVAAPLLLALWTRRKDPTSPLPLAVEVWRHRHLLPKTLASREVKYYPYTRLYRVCKEDEAGLAYPFIWPQGELKCKPSEQSLIKSHDPVTPFQHPPPLTSGISNEEPVVGEEASTAGVKQESEKSEAKEEDETPALSVDDVHGVAFRKSESGKAKGETSLSKRNGDKGSLKANPKSIDGFIVGIEASSFEEGDKAMDLWGSTWF